ncbi:hypothetical protein CJ430_31925, partial [Klebsiella pneumoniae]
TTAEIASVAGVAKATLYANFSDKEHLIEAVLRLEVTTAEIASVAGVAKATLYANFSDKEHLIEAVLR